ncbi:MAG: hypothetical protein ACLU6Y_01450 [Ruminococcus sp.]
MRDLSTGLQSLVEQAGQIGEDIVGSLIAGIQKAGTGGTLLDVNVIAGWQHCICHGSSGSVEQIHPALLLQLAHMGQASEIAPAQRSRAGYSDREAQLRNRQRLQKYRS